MYVCLWHGEVPEWPKGADCKSVGYTFEGSNPSLSKLEAFFFEEGLFSVRYVQKGVLMHCFYEKGLQFSCVEGCVYCCSCEPGFVFLSKEDLERLCRFTSLDEQQFIATYCRKVNMGSFSMISLLERENFDCIFLTKQGCSVYEARPKQCRTYPFWRSVMESQESWEAEKQSCPGIGKGRHYSRSEIDALLRTKAGQEPILCS